ncbi:hypothetical protein ASF58_22770 [Methylobacterium sp. Leaf125]|uniref:hypothetical protein n=1 Tax=Methylobacterium sp. Leaf125 TaxID=1736265 RepID=UPI0006F962A4|nr:hypothetical protein [Methylobacterium sp. Leaf125]KQQ39119.1 hypothetical protein ASF58_22770 [Methylobacterium sp. Leaf125]
MGLFSAITGDASLSAYNKNKQAIGATQNLSGDALTQGYANAQSLLGTGNGSGGNALQALGAGYGQSRNDLTGQYGQTQSFLGQIGDVYGGLTKSGQQATDARSDALGLNGAEGNARASQAFQGSLGYGAGLDEGLDAVMRTASARGNLSGGNTSRDLFNYAADYQNKQAGNYINNLSTAGTNYATGAAGTAAGLGLQGAASQSLGSGLSSLAQSFGQNSAGLYGTASGQQAQFGQGVAGVQQNAGNALVQNNSALAASQNQASSNFLGGLLGLGQLAASPVGQNGATGTAGGSLITSLANIFK